MMRWMRCAVGLMRKQVNWVLDADIRGFFDTIDHEWMLKFLEHRIADRRVLRLIQKWLRAGVSEDGTLVEDGGGDSARGGDFAAASEHLPALRLRSVGSALANASRDGRRDRGPLRGRYRHGIRASAGRGAIPGSMAGRGCRSSGWSSAPRQDAPDRVRSSRGRASEAARRRQAGDVRLPGLHAHLWDRPGRRVRFIVKRKTIRKRLRRSFSR